MPDESMKIELDGSSVVSQAEAMAKSFGILNEKMMQTIGVSVKYNKEGTATGVVLKKLNSQLNEVTETFKINKKTQEAVLVSGRQYVESLSAQQKAMLIQQSSTRALAAIQRTELQVARELAKEQRDLARARESGQRQAQLFARAGANLGAGALSRSQIGAGAASLLGVQTAAGGLAVGLGVGGIVAFGNAIKHAAEDGLEFERGLAKISATSGLTGFAISEIRKEMLELSTQFGIPIADVQAASLAMFRSHIVSIADRMEFMARSAELARAAFTTQEESVKALTQVMRNFGLTAKDTTLISDVLLKAMHDGGPTIDEFATSSARVTTVLGPLGVGFKETVALMTALERTGLPASAASDRLATSFERVNIILRQNHELQAGVGAKDLKELIAMTGSAASAFDVLLKSMQGSRQGLDEFSDSAFGQGGLIALTKALQDAKGEFARLDGATGETARALQAMEDNAGASLTRLSNTIHNKMVEIGVQVVKDLAPALNNLNKLLGGKNPEDQPRTEAEQAKRDSERDDINKRNKAFMAKWDKGATIEENFKRLAEAEQKEAAKADFMKVRGRELSLTEQFNAEVEHLRELNTIKMKSNLEQAVLDKERTAEIKSQLEIQVKDFEETMRDETAAEHRAKAERVKMAQALDSDRDEFQKGRFDRQMKLVSDPNMRAMLQAARTQKTSSGAGDMLDQYSKLSGADLAQSKLPERALAMADEGINSAKQHFDQVLAVKHTKNDILLAEQNIVNATRTKRDLEERILAISKAQEVAARDKAAKMAQQFDIAKQGIDEALKIGITDSKGGARDKDVVMKDFDLAQSKALRGAQAAGVSQEGQLQMQMQLGQRRQILEDEFKRSQDQRTIAGGVGNARGLANMGQEKAAISLVKALEQLTSVVAAASGQKNLTVGVGGSKSLASDNSSHFSGSWSRPMPESGHGNMTMNDNGQVINITVQGTPGQSPQEIAKAVDQQIRKVDRRYKTLKTAKSDE